MKVFKLKWQDWEIENNYLFFHPDINKTQEQFEKDINDVVLFNVTKPYLSSKLYWTFAGQNINYNQFRIMQISHKWLNNNGQDVLTTWKLRHVLFAFAPTEF